MGVCVLEREREREKRERERERERWKHVYREREGECFEIEGVCREIESVCKGSVCLEREGEYTKREISTCRNKEYKKAKSFIWMF